MVQPRNYMIDVQSPFQAFGEAAQFGLGLAELDARRQAAQKEAVRQESLSKEIARVNAIQNPSAADFRTLSFLLPAAQMTSVRETFKLGSQEQQDNQLSFSGKVLSAFTTGNNQIGIDLLLNRAEAEENAGRSDQAKGFRDYAELARINPGAARTTIGMMIASLPGGDKIIDATTKAQMAPLELAKARSDLAPKRGFTLLTPAQNIEAGLDPDLFFQRGPNGQLEELRISAKKGFRILTKEENVARNLDPGVTYQLNEDTREVKPLTPGPLVQMGQTTDQLVLEKLTIPIVQGLVENAASARNLAQDSETINNLLKDKKGGALVKLQTDIARKFGFSTETVTTDDLVNALATRGAVLIRAAGSGSTSDIEFKSYLQAFPSLSNSQEGRKLMAKYARLFADRSAKIATHARKLVKENKFSEEELARYDDSLGPLLDKDFYDLTSQSQSQRPNVPRFLGTTPTPATPAPAPAPPAARPSGRFLGFE